MIPYMKVTYRDPNGAETDLSGYVLNANVSKGAEAKKNSLNIEFQNQDGRLNSLNFTIDQSSVTFWLDWLPISSQDPLISTTVSAISYPTNNDGRYRLKVKGTDKTGLFLSKLWASAYTESENWNSPNMIINVVGHLNDLDMDDDNDLTTDNVATTRSDGSAFPLGIAMSKIWKPGFEWINELSQPELTGENLPYVYFVDSTNDLHWHYPYQKPATYLTSSVGISDTTINVQSTTQYPSSGAFVIEDEVILYTGKTSTTFTGCTRGAHLTSATTHASETTVSGQYLYLGRQDIYKMDIETTEDATYNFIIFNGGETPNGYELLDYILDFSQVGRKFRMKFFDWKSVGKDMTNREKGRTEWGTDKTSSYPRPGDSPLSGGNPYTPLWTSTPVTSNSAYHDSFVTELTKRCQNKANAYFVTGKQKYKATVQMRGTNAYDINDMVNIVSPKFNQVRLLRVKGIKHQINSGSWITDIELEEDPTPQSVND